jgi:hypothetical protein
MIKGIGLFSQGIFERLNEIGTTEELESKFFFSDELA